MGAAGYLVKKAAPSDLRLAINAIAQGGAFLYPRPGEGPHSLVCSVSRNGNPGIDRSYIDFKPCSSSACVDPSWGRGAQIGSGRFAPNQDIADQLTLSIKTVQTHRANVMEKLDLRDITHLVRFAVRHKLIAE